MYRLYSHYREHWANGGPLSPLWIPHSIPLCQNDIWIPVKLIATFLGNTDFELLISVEFVLETKSLRRVAWLNFERLETPNLVSGGYERSFHHSSLRSIVPRSNWISIPTFTLPDFILFESSLPWTWWFPSGKNAPAWLQQMIRSWMVGWSGRSIILGGCRPISGTYISCSLRLRSVNDTVIECCIVSGTELTRPALRMKFGLNKWCAFLRMAVSK